MSGKTTVPVWVEVEDLPAQGWLLFLWQGEENTYFRRQDGVEIYTKILAPPTRRRRRESSDDNVIAGAPPDEDFGNDTYAW